jgi:cysteine desulfurase
MPRVYMDANATTPLLPEVMEAMRPFWIGRRPRPGGAGAVLQLP